MKKHKIQIQGFALCGGIQNAGQLYKVRKKHIKETYIGWINTGVGINHAVNCVYDKQIPVFIFLN